jgi:hypothetical protein
MLLPYLPAPAWGACLCVSRPAQCVQALGGGRERRKDKPVGDCCLLCELWGCVWHKTKPMEACGSGHTLCDGLPRGVRSPVTTAARAGVGGVLFCRFWTGYVCVCVFCFWAREICVYMCGGCVLLLDRIHVCCFWTEDIYKHLSVDLHTRPAAAACYSFYGFGFLAYGGGMLPCGGAALQWHKLRVAQAQANTPNATCTQHVWVAVAHACTCCQEDPSLTRVCDGVL